MSEAEDRVDPNEYELRKRLPPRFFTRKNDVYVTKKTNFKAQMARCERLLNSGEYPDVTIHGLGPAVNLAINLALQIKRRGLGSIDLEVNTGSVTLTDDLVPLVDEAVPGSRNRSLSTLHIRLFRPDTPVTDY